MAVVQPQVIQRFQHRLLPPMALHTDFPTSPYEILPPDQRWFPAAENLRETAYEKLLPPLVAKIRVAVSEWRASGYLGAFETSKALLAWWFETDHMAELADGSQPVPLLLCATGSR